MKTNTRLLAIASGGCAVGGLILLLTGEVPLAGMFWAVACIFSGLAYTSLKKEK